MLALSLILLTLALGTIFVIFLTSREHDKSIESFTKDEIVRLQRSFKGWREAADRAIISWEEMNNALEQIRERAIE